jgi:predicted CoA-binding protein
MPSRALIDDFLAQDHLAFVGVSRNPKDFANAVYRQLRDGGRTMYPVNASCHEPELEGDRCYPSLAEVPDPVAGVIVMVPATAAAAVARDAIDRGIPRVWLHRGVGRGSVSDDAVALCREHDVSVVDGACPLMFAEPVAAFHRVHRFFAKRRIAA